MSFMRTQDFRSSNLDRRLRFRSPMVPSAPRMTPAWQDISSPGALIGMPAKHALGLVQYLRTIGYAAWIEDTNGNAIDEKALKMAIRSRHEDAPSS